ncbi:MAG TPA: hypothetical protein VH085_11915 [Nocardioides sp.]|nr:hypothetical protein [Nocardioides sp.]
MTTTLGEAAPPSSRTGRQPVALCVAVGLVVTVGWVCYRHWGLVHVDTWAARSSFVAARWWLVNLVTAMGLCVPYALALVLWGRGLGPALAGAGVALLTGLALWGIDRVFDNYVWGSGPTTVTSLRVYLWAELLVPALLVPLAWGLARRRGRAWWSGLVVGPIVAAGLRELQLRWAWWDDRVGRPGHDYRWQLQAVVFVAPFVLAVLACWAIEARARRTPEMPKSA